jgi:DNA-binding MarR family transcriptional regulator
MSQARYSVIPTQALEDDRVSATELRVLAVIGSFLDKDLQAFPKQATIAERAKCSRQTVNKAVKNLADYGYLTILGSPKGGLKRALRYAVNLDVKLDDIEAEAVVFPDVKKGDNDVSKIDNDVKPRGDNRCKALELTAIEDTQVKIPTHQARKSAQSVCDEILKILPPRKRAMAPRDSLPKVVKTILRKTEPEELLAAVERCYSTERHVAEEGQYAPAIYSWLSKGVWKNWLEDVDVVDAELSEEEWASAFRHYVDSGDWLIPDVSPAPHEPGCKGPAKMLRHAADLLVNNPKRVAAIQQNITARAA